MNGDERGNEDNGLGNKAKFNRRIAIRRKNANPNQQKGGNENDGGQRHGEEWFHRQLNNLNEFFANGGRDHGVNMIKDNFGVINTNKGEQGKCSASGMMTPLSHTNVCSFRMYSTYCQNLLSYTFQYHYASSLRSSQVQNNCNQLTNLFDNFIDEELKLGQLNFAKNIPRVVSLGFNVLLDIISDSFQSQPSICLRSLESFLNLLHGMKPESLKNEPADMLDKIFNLITSLITFSLNPGASNYTMSSMLQDSYYHKVLRLCLSIFLSLSIARGDSSKVLLCIKTLLTESMNNDSSIILDNYRTPFHLEIPEIVVLLKKNATAYLLGKNSIPEWCTHGFPRKAMCETFSIKYSYQQHQTVGQSSIDDHTPQSHCGTSIAFNEECLILYRCNRFYSIGSGYNDTVQGVEMFSSEVAAIFQSVGTKQEQQQSLSCCQAGPWIGYVSGELFFQPSSAHWSTNNILLIEPKTFAVKATLSLVSNYANNPIESPFAGPTIPTTDGDYIILITALRDDYFVVRELKPLRINVEEANQCDQQIVPQDKITFSLSSELTVRLSSVILMMCGQSMNNMFNIPTQNASSQLGQPPSYSSYRNLKQIDTSGLFEYKHMRNVICGKDFALLLTEQGKVYYTGSSLSLGIRHSFSFGKWSLLTIPKPVKIDQIAVGHEGGHALLLSNDGTVFFVGTAKRGEDGDNSLPQSCHRLNKPCRVKKFAKLIPNIVPEFVACNYGTSSIVSKSGELYLFGKDTRMLDTDTNGLVSIEAKYKIKAIALGKAHALMLTKAGQVLTCGFSNKGQCGLEQGGGDQDDQNGGIELDSKNDDDDLELKTRPHLFGYGKTQYCFNCSRCTEHGLKCPNFQNRTLESNQSLSMCGCCDGNTGCVYCGLCQDCAMSLPNKGCVIDMAKYRLGDGSQETESMKTAKFWAQKCLGTGEASTSDATIRMSSIPPTILPLTRNVKIIQVAAGLHHSVLLTEAGHVYTFGSNAHGQLGHGDVMNRSTPTKVKTEMVAKGQITQVAAGSNHTMLLTSFGEVLTFGSNIYNQLGRQEYSSCQLGYVWNTFPGKMENIGPSWGRIASFINASGDFSFIKYDEILVSPNLLTQAKLMVERNNLILIPPTNWEVSGENVSEEKCTHNLCKKFCGQTIEKEPTFNNLNTNILILSRINGSCMVLNRSGSFGQASNHSDKAQFDFEQYSSIFIDKFYHNLWTFNSDRDEFARFDLISLEATVKLAKIHADRSKTSISIKFPNSWNNLHPLNDGDSSSTKHLSNIPSVLQPNLSLPLIECTNLTKTPQQLGIEILSLLTSLTYSHLFGISINDNKLDNFNYLARSIFPEEYAPVCRFEDYGNSWGYTPNSVEAIRFSTDSDIILGGVGLYGGRGEYSTRIKLYDIGFEGGEIEKEGDLITETDIINYECLSKQKFQAYFDEPILVQANRWYVVCAWINGPSSDCGSNGQTFVYTTDQVIFTFKSSKLSNNGTDVNAGQIPVLLYKPVKSNELNLALNNNGNTNTTTTSNSLLNYSVLSLDEEGLPFYITKDFTLKVNSTSLFILCNLLQHVWHNIKTWLGGGDFASNSDYLQDRLRNLIEQVRRQAYIACFTLELIRVYVHILLPSSSSSSSSIASKGNQFDYDEFESMANSLHLVATELSTILTEHDELVEQLIRATTSVARRNEALAKKVNTLVQLTYKILDECYETYYSCCRAFYPSDHLKWSALCDHITWDMIGKKTTRRVLPGQSPKQGYSSRQKYILGALLKSFCCPSIKLITFLRIGRMQQKVFDDCVPVYSNLSCHMISKKLAKLFDFCSTHPAGSEYTTLNVFQSLLHLIVKPIEGLLNVSSALSSSEGGAFSNNCHNKVDNHFASPSSSSPAAESTSSDEECDNGNSDFTSGHLSYSPKFYASTKNNLYSKKLTSVSCNLALKLITEFAACAVGVLRNEASGELHSSQVFASNPEFVTPARFCRRSPNRNWDGGNATPDAICFSVNKDNIYLSGVRAYSCAGSSMKFQLQIFDQMFDDSKTMKWKMITSVSGVCLLEDNQLNKSVDYCDIRFDTPVLIQANTKYAILLKNFNSATYGGDIGLPQVRGDDETMFTFMDCSMSKNGTNLNRGQIPHILYYNISKDQLMKMSHNSQLEAKTDETDRLDYYIYVLATFRFTIEKANGMLSSLIMMLKEYLDNVQQQSDHGFLATPRDQTLLDMLNNVFASTFFLNFFPAFTLVMSNILPTMTSHLCFSLLNELRSIIPLVAELNNLMVKCFHDDPRPKRPPTTSAYYLTVESDHPYKTSSVANYFVKFPSSVKWMMIEFDPKCQTAHVDDYLELYIPYESYRHYYTDMNLSDKSNPAKSSLFPKKFINIYQKFHGQHFFKDKPDATVSLFVPGHDLLLMLKTSAASLGINNLRIEQLYGFQVQAIGYTTPFDRVTTSKLKQIGSRKDQLYNVYDMVHKLENEVVYISNQTINRLLVCSPENIFEDLKIDCCNPKKLGKYVLSPPAFETAKGIFRNHHSLLHKSFNLQGQVCWSDVKQFQLPNSPINAFLEDFINLRPQSSGARLAFWLQNESFISPNSCLLNVIQHTDLCCERCLPHLLQESNTTYRLCSQCYYRLFVKSKLNKGEQKIASFGMKVFITMITRDQYEEIAFDPNSAIEVNVRLVSMYSANEHSKMTVMGESEYEAPMHSLITSTPYRETIDNHDLLRYHSITMMQEFADYSLEELRYHAHRVYKKKTTIETMQMKSLNNGYYFTTWTPNESGCYAIELIIDGEPNHNSFVVEVVANKSNAHQSSMPPISESFDGIPPADYSQSRHQGDDCRPSSAASLHSIRKFVCNDSAGLRIRALPSLQSEQIGILEVNGLLTVVDHLENEDGVWVRLSNESIQAYCNYLLSDLYSHYKEAYLNDNFDSNAGEFIGGDLKPCYASPSLRTEAWALEYNKHFNRTLLVSIETEPDKEIEEGDEQEDLFTVPAWYKVVCPDGVIIHGSPIDDVQQQAMMILGLLPQEFQIQGVKMVQNELGTWIRLGVETMNVVIANIYLTEKRHEGWILAQAASGLSFVQKVKEEKAKPNSIGNSNNGSNNGSNKYSADDEHKCIVQPKRALSNSAAKCIRSIFAAFVWHEGILHDVLTAASYLKFNAEITKHRIKCFNDGGGVSEDNNDNNEQQPPQQQQQQQQQLQPACFLRAKGNRKSNRNSKSNIRHSVEVSQLFSFWASDINSNLNELLGVGGGASSAEHDNCNNNNNNNNEQLRDEARHEQVLGGAELAMIPEILINLLKLWDFISFESLQLFTLFNVHLESRMVVVGKRPRPDHDDSFNEMTCNGSEQQQPQQSDIDNKCECGIDQQGEDVQEYHRLDQQAYEPVRTIQQFYGSLRSSAYYLLTLVPVNTSSLTGLTLNDSLYDAQQQQQQQSSSSSLFEEDVNNQNRLRFKDYEIVDQYDFKVLSHLCHTDEDDGYAQQKLVEEKLSTLAIVALKQESQQEFVAADNGESESSNLADSVRPDILNERRKSFKFYRSISVGLNGSFPSNSSRAKGQSSSSSKKYVADLEGIMGGSNENLNDDLPFLVKPSSRLLAVVGECAQLLVAKEGQPQVCAPKHQSSLVDISSSLFHRDVFKFIFAGYNIHQLTLIGESNIYASFYRAMALQVLNWMLVNVSTPMSLHDVLWTFVHAIQEIEAKGRSVDLKTDRKADQEIQDGQQQQSQKDTKNEDKSIKLMSTTTLSEAIDLSKHPFNGLLVAGDSAECWVSESMRQFIKSVSTLLPFLPSGTPLQQMAIKCFGIDFYSRDHIFLHECKVFAHISAILTRSSAALEASYRSLSNRVMDEEDKKYNRNSYIASSRDITPCFELKTSSRMSMALSLVDKNTETFWESGNDDRNKMKYILLGNVDKEKQPSIDSMVIKFVFVYIDNQRDIEHLVSQVIFKLITDKDDAFKFNEAPTSNFGSEKLDTFNLEPQFCGWLQCELDDAQSAALCDASKFMRIEFLGLGPSVRVRQVKVVATAKWFEFAGRRRPLPQAIDFNSSGSHNDGLGGKVLSAQSSMQMQMANCEAETLQVFRRLTAQVFGKLLSSNEGMANGKNKQRWSQRQSGGSNGGGAAAAGVSNAQNETDLREHMVGILFSQESKLSELQKQVCSHIVREIHSETSRLKDEWSRLVGQSNTDGRQQQQQHNSQLLGAASSDSYCFELLSLVLALSGSQVGCRYLAKQHKLFYDIMTLLHTSSDRVKRQTFLLMRRVLPSISVASFAQLLGVAPASLLVMTNQGLPMLAKTVVGSTGLEVVNKENAVLEHVGLLDMWLACIAKALTVPIKVKGQPSNNRKQSRMSDIFGGGGGDGHCAAWQQQQPWWLKGMVSPAIAQLIITILRDMKAGSFGAEWAQISRSCIAEKIINLSRLTNVHQTPDECIKTSTFWLAVAALCVLDEQDAELLSAKKFHDKENGNIDKVYCDNHDDGETTAYINCGVCGNLCIDCDRFLHLNPKTRTHRRHIFQKEADSIKVDIHEGCGRLKFCWSLIIADAKQLKAMAEFRANNLGDNEKKEGGNECQEITGTCRFCGSCDSGGRLAFGNVCNNEECQRFAAQACTATLACGHRCGGLVNETKCMPCLQPQCCSATTAAGGGGGAELNQDGEDMCMVCFSESLLAAPCIQLACRHIFHAHCVRAVLERRWIGGRITFTFAQCPICKVAIKHVSLAEMLQPIEALYEDVKRKALMRLEYEGLARCEAITTPGGRFYNNPAGLAMEKYSYYLCFKCHKAYFGGEVRCDIEYDNGDNFNHEELICGSCSNVTQAQICPKHGTDYLEYKCRYCCSVAVYFCFGSTHFCNACHEDFQRLVTVTDHPECPVGPRGNALPIDECPLHMAHPPTGEEFALGCGICRNTHTF